MKETYKQCHLSSGTQRQVAWILERGAKKGASVELLEDGTTWKVDSVGASATREEVLTQRDAYRTQRRASDI